MSYKGGEYMLLKIILPIIILVFYMTILLFAFKSKRFFFTVFLNGIIGLLLFAILDFIAIFTGVFLPINKYTVFGCATFGIPAVILFIILQIIFL